VDQEPDLSFFAVRIDVSPASLHPDDLPKNLRFRHRFKILLEPCVSAKKKQPGNITSMIDSDHAMGDQMFGGLVEENVPGLNSGWGNRLHGDGFTLSDTGVHAPSQRTKTNAFTLAQQLLAKVSEKVTGCEAYGTGKSRFGHTDILTFPGEILQHRNSGKGRNNGSEVYEFRN
jgi:hypothetical protein